MEVVDAVHATMNTVTKLTTQWERILEACIQEVHEADEPLRSEALEQHIAGIGTFRIDLSRVDFELGVAVGMYIELLFQCQEKVVQKDRFGALTRLRYLQNTWLPEFREKLAISCSTPAKKGLYTF